MKIAVILSGCGVLDGTEINEAVLTLLAIDKANAHYQCFALNSLYNVIDHLSKTPTPEQRNGLIEAARIARGQIQDIKDADLTLYDALIFPGGYGAANNLCDFALSEENFTIHPQVYQFAKAFIDANKPLGFICIAPVMIPKLYPPGVRLTLGTDKAMAQKMQAMGAHPINCSVTDIVIDKQHKVVSTPAYMLASRISDAAQGIEKLVQAVLAMA